MLPYLGSDPKSGVAPYDCRTCRDPDATVGYMPDEVRAGWHCGWMDRNEWTALTLTPDMFEGGLEMPDGTACDVCPGYLRLLPQVSEAREACWALRKNVLPVYFPDASDVLLEAAKVLDQSFAEYEARRLAENASKQ